MTPEEASAMFSAVPEATNEEIADVFVTYAPWGYEPSYYMKAKVALAAAKARGLTWQDLVRISDERKREA